MGGGHLKKCSIRRFPPPEVIEALSNKPVLIYVSTLNEASSKERTSQDLGVSEKKDEEKRFLLQLVRIFTHLTEIEG